jgi:hypothetical protein
MDSKNYLSTYNIVNFKHNYLVFTIGKTDDKR